MICGALPMFSFNVCCCYLCCKSSHMTYTLDEAVEILDSGDIIQFTNRNPNKWVQCSHWSHTGDFNQYRSVQQCVVPSWCAGVVYVEGSDKYVFEMATGAQKRDLRIALELQQDLARDTSFRRLPESVRSACPSLHPHCCSLHPHRPSLHPQCCSLHHP